MAAGRLSLRARGRRGGHWRAGRSGRACTSGVSLTRPTGGSRNRRRWRPRMRSGWPVRRRWPTGRGSPGSGAVLTNSGCWPRRPPSSCGSTEPGKVIGVAPLALGVSLAARGQPEQALPLIERGVAFSRTFGQPIQLANALLGQAPALRALGEHQRAADAVAEARSVLESCPDPGILTGRLAALDRSPQIRRARSADQELTQREFRVLTLLQRRSVRAGDRPSAVCVAQHRP